MKTASPFTPEERIESLKVTILGGSCAGLMSMGILLSYRLVYHSPLPQLSHLLSSMAGLTLLANWAIAILSGALFALTYRYAIRQDQNPQLNAGVILAFTLVRGLAQVDAGSAIAQKLWPFLSACGESLLIFGGSAVVLNLAFQQNWVKPFNHS